MSCKATEKDPHTHGLWALTAPPPPSGEPLAGDIEADVVIIGAGYTGLAAAARLAGAGKHVRVLEAHAIGWGCSGRNGGQVNPGGKVELGELVDRFGAERGQAMFKLMADAPQRVFDLVDAHAIDCEAVRPGFILGGFGARAKKTLRRRQQDWRSMGRDARFLSHQDIAELTGTDVYHCGLLFPAGGNLNPLAYVRGLARIAIAAGALVHEKSPATSIERHGAAWRVTAGAAHVTAPEVIIATNGYTDDVWPGLKQGVVKVRSAIAATDPLSESLRRRILPHRHAVSETLRLIVYFKLDAAGRFVIGARAPLSAGDGHAAGELARRRALGYFPDLAGVSWSHTWSGDVAITRTHLPAIARLAPGVLAVMGYNGRGVAMATVLGDQAARHLLDDDPLWPVGGLDRFPLHRFRKAGVALSLAAMRFCDRLDRAGR